MLSPGTDYPPEVWVRIHALFEKMMDASDPAAVLAAETDPVIAGAADRLHSNHQQAQAKGFLDEPITLVRNLHPESDAPSSDWEGRIFSHFRIIRKLGQGGMGKVYLAEDLTLGRKVALKFLALKPDSGSGALLERFRREARAAAALKHPHICTIHGVEECDGEPVIEMEFVEGETLAARIARGALSLPEALTLTIQIAGALAEAHRRGIVHRDLKPANIMLTQFGPKVLDFGLARIIFAEGVGEETATLTHTSEGTVMGTPYYMSPEQARGEDADGRADLFSLGVVLYEMTTGARPFIGKSSPAILAAVLKENPVSPSQRRPPLPARLDEIVGKALEKDRFLRYQSAEDLSSDCQALQRELESERLEIPVRGKPPARLSRPGLIGVATVLTVAAGLAMWLLTAHKAHALSATDTVVLADFANSTGDGVFDDTLKEALSADLAQSPFLGILPEQTVSATLKLMGRPKNTPLGKDAAREVCLRAGARAYIAGSIAHIGTQYLIQLQAVECQSLDVMARAQETAAGKEQVLHALDNVAKQLREKVGESLQSLERFATPLEQVTTPSLEALRAYTMGRKAMATGDYVGAAPLFQYAVRLDPKFAMAILSLGLCQDSIWETIRSVANFREAFELRERVSESERFAIESRYYFSVVGSLDQARKIYATWWKTYPRADIAVSNVGAIESTLGQHNQAVEHYREALRLRPTASHYAALGNSYLSLDRLDEARSMWDEMVTRKIDAPDTHVGFYLLAFLRNDAAGMAKEVAWSAGKSGVEDVFLGLEAHTAAYSGRVAASRQFALRAANLAREADENEVVADYEALAGLREALFGYRAETRRQVAAVLRLSHSRYVVYGAALALAVAGDTRQAQAVADELDKGYPSDTIVQYICLPAIRGRLAIGRKDYVKALEILQAAVPYELGYEATLTPSLYAAQVRAEAYLGAGRNAEAAAECQKILSHRGLVNNTLIGPLARLNLARAYAGQRDWVKATENYEEFLGLWKDADAGIPILKEAQAEYKKLKSGGHLR